MLRQYIIPILRTLTILPSSLTPQYLPDLADSHARPHESFKHVHATVIQGLFPERTVHVLEVFYSRDADAPEWTDEGDAVG
jgi:hypothetical protein